MTENYSNILWQKISWANSIKHFLMHLCICMAVYVAPSGAIFIPFIALLLILFYKNDNKAGVLIVGVYALCCKSESVYFVYNILFFALFLLDKRKSVSSPAIAAINKRMWYFLGYLVILYVFQLFDERNILSLPFFLITFASPILVMYYVWHAGITAGDIRRFLYHFLLIAIVQSLIGFLLQAVGMGISAILARPTLGDVVMGNTNNSNSLAFLIFAAVLPFVTILLTSRKYFNRFQIAGTAIVFMFFSWLIYLNDAKTLYFSFVLAAAFLFFRNYLLFTKRIGRRVFYVSLFTVVAIALSSAIYNKFQEVVVSYDDYITGKYNAKWQYYTSTFATDTRPAYQYILGTGAGTNGSRAGNALAYDVLYKKDNTITLPKFIPPKSNNFTKHYLSKYFDADYADASGDRSALLGNPFNSICAIYVEFGLVGVFLFAQLLYVICRELIKRNTFLSITAIILLLSDVVIGFVDQSLERPGQMFFTYLFIGLAFVPISLKQSGKNIQQR